MRIELGIAPVQGRAIGADDLVVGAHVEEDVRMVERRLGADAHEFLGADFDHRHAGIVMEMGDDMFRHEKSLFEERFGGRTIARRRRRA